MPPSSTYDSLSAKREPPAEDGPYTFLFFPFSKPIGFTSGSLRCVSAYGETRIFHRAPTPCQSLVQVLYLYQVT